MARFPISTSPNSSLLSVVFAAILASVAVWLFTPAVAYADDVIGDGTPGSCQTNQASNDFTNAVIAGGVVSFDCGAGTVEIIVNTTVVDKKATVNGNGRIILNGEDLRQIFIVTGSGDLTLNDIVLTDGNAGQGGAVPAVYQQGKATINRSTISSSSAAGDGGAIHNRGALAINDSTLGSNIAGVNGGGILNNGGAVIIRRSYLISNQAQSGGGIYTVNGNLDVERSALRSNTVTGNGGGVFASSITQIVNSTFSNNRANEGGALYAVASTTIASATFNDNRADTGGAMYRAASANPMTLHNTIVANSLEENTSSPSLNCDGPTLGTLGRNIIGDNTCVPNPSSNGDLLSTDPKLGVWQGTPTRGYIPAQDSPAIDYGQGCPALDQRGLPRPLGSACDVGAMERGSLIFLSTIKHK